MTYRHHSRCSKTIRGDACDMPVDCARMNDRAGAFGTEPLAAPRNWINMSFVWICKNCNSLDPGPRKCVGRGTSPPDPCPICKGPSAPGGVAIYSEQLDSFRNRYSYKHHPRCSKTIRGDACDMPVDCARMNDKPNPEEHRRDIQPTLWRVSCVLSSDPAQDEPIDLNAPTGSVLVLAWHPVTWIDVKRWSWRLFKSDHVTITRSMEGPPDFELRWIGSDSGPYPDKHMQVKTGRKDWEDL